jgi:hypothetical protein
MIQLLHPMTLSIRTVLRRAIVCLGLVLTVVFWSMHQPAYAQTTTQPTAYLNAVEDAKVAEPSEIYRGLTAINASNKNLVWKADANTVSKKRLAVVTWVAAKDYQYYPVGQVITSTRDTWVTVVPDLKNFCQANAKSASNLTSRLEQLMGIPANNGKAGFVQFWVDPNDLFRPSPDPEISDSESSLDYPTLPTPEQKKWLDKNHKQWIENLKATSYGQTGKMGYPWTRLGYTYDWGNSKTEVGLSEFVLATGSSIQVDKIEDTAVYCK